MWKNRVEDALIATIDAKRAAERKRKATDEKRRRRAARLATPRVLH